MRREYGLLCDHLDSSCIKMLQVILEEENKDITAGERGGELRCQSGGGGGGGGGGGSRRRNDTSRNHLRTGN